MPYDLVTKMNILRPAEDVYEAFADPAKIGNFWFSASSGRWETGKTISLAYAEYGASMDIRIVEAVENEIIAFDWGEGDYWRRVDMFFNPVEGGTEVEVHELFTKEDENLADFLVGNKEGWVFMLTCLKAWLENGVNTLRTGLVV